MLEAHITVVHVPIKPKLATLDEPGIGPETRTRRQRPPNETREERPE
jgi:hypothetical protein